MRELDRIQRQAFHISGRAAAIEEADGGRQPSSVEGAPHGFLVAADPAAGAEQRARLLGLDLVPGVAAGVGAAGGFDGGEHV
jgi:hypothetical protein